MNILRWKRKSNNKIRPKTLLLFIFSLIMTTFAWFAYSKVLEPTLNIHMASWDMTYEINGEPTENPIVIEIPILSPNMQEETVIVDIFNNGETDVDIDHEVKSMTIAGIKYVAVEEGETPTSSNYITIAAPVLETVETTETTTDEETGETTTTTTTRQVYKGAVTNDITRFPFTIEIEYSAQVEAATKALYGGSDTPGEGYLKVTVNWVGDNDRLDSEWGYLVGDYLANQPEGTPAMTIELSIDSYQVDPNGEDIETTMPSTSTTRPYLPDGYTRVPGTSLTTGLVIEDANGNQYVWVEVPRAKSVYTTAGIEITDFTDETVYTKIETDLRNYVSAYSTREDVFLNYDATGLSTETYPALKKKMLKSIYSHGGFYIGRYETGVEGEARTKATSTTPSTTPVIKANVYPYNWVTCSQANTIAGRLSQTGYTTSLMFGLQWDLVLKYLETKGALEDGWLTTDSTSWGNYVNNTYTLTNSTARYNQSTTGWLTSIPFEKSEGAEVLVSSGANSGFCMQNIYDFAGNLSEWTYNVVKDDTTGNYLGGNGGNYLTDGADTPANYYGSYNTMTGLKHVGFRIALISEAEVTEAWGAETVDSEIDTETDTTGPYLPSGFEYVDDPETDVTIADSSGNQYVWVEVPKSTDVYTASTLALDLDSLSGDELTAAYTAIEEDLHTYTSTYRNGTSHTDTWSSEAATGIASADEYNALKYTMLKSVFENGGFYVGKYEAGTATARASSSDTLTDVVIQANAYPYNYVTNKQAQSLASGMASGEYTTSLMFGVQWDLVLKYLETSNAATVAELNSNSTEWGNYYNNTYTTNASSKYSTDYGANWTDGSYDKTTSDYVLLSAGASTEFQKAGIYDIAGNVFEWTLEYTYGIFYPCASRGGRYDLSGSNAQASCRGGYGTSSAYDFVGFRVALY